MAAIADGSVSIDSSKNIRWTGDATTMHTVLEFHRWLGKLADDEQAVPDDIMDISRLTPSDRSTDNIITLINGYNIDDTLAQHLFDGSVTQNGGDDIYAGVVVSGSFYDANSEIIIIQNNKVLANYWGTGINKDATAKILLRTLVKVRSGGSDIDGKRLRVAVREMGSIFAEFEFTAGEGNSYPALFSEQDLNNQTATATIESWTTVSNVEGFQAIDLGDGSGPHDYYSQWNKATYTINQLYERTKWIAARAHVLASNETADQDTRTLDDTYSLQGQSFELANNDIYLRRIRVQLKRVGNPSGNITCVLKAHTGTYGTSSVPTGAALATSNVIPATRLTTAYASYEFVFDTPYEMSASTDYYTFEISFSTGDASNYIIIYSNSSSSYGGNAFNYDATYNADSTEDLWFRVYASPDIHGIPGELFRGITHEIDWESQTISDTFDENEIVTWGSGATAGSGIILADSEAGVDAGQTGTSWIQQITGAAPVDALTLTGQTSGVTATISTSGVTERNLKSIFFGQSIGTAIIGAYGIGVESSDLSVNDKLFDLTNAQRTPPNNVTWYLYGVVIGEDRILVGPKDTGDAFKFTQMTLAVTLDGGTETVVNVGAGNIPPNTPASGTLRVELDSGIYRYVVYDSHDSNDEFTLNASYQNWADPNDATIGNDVMVSYIDKLAGANPELFTTIHTVDLDLRVRVRDGGGTPIKTAETNSTLTSAGGSATANRVDDY